MTHSVRLTTFALFVLLTKVGSAQQAAPAAVGSLLESKVAASTLKTNVLGDPAESRVAVYLPPSYQTSPQRRYPTLFLLHGFLSDIEAYTRGWSLVIFVCSLLLSISPPPAKMRQINPGEEA